ncbi:MAG: hypothetical protein HXY41_07345 [Chloroflexi bacterium]|nr:hypothetical protein [Chloroflexota bacterium]
MSSVDYALEHFYYGQLMRDGQAEDELCLLAASAGIKPEQVGEAVKQALLPPLAGSPGGAWALVRGRQNVPFVLVQSVQGEAGQNMLHYIIAQPEMLRAMGGNLKALMRLLEDRMPTYDHLGDKLPLLTLPAVEPPSAEAQVEDILHLMSCTHNRIDTIEALLAGIVQGVPVAVRNAPPEMEQRVLFVQGLLALLPPSARFGVTFATHSLSKTRMDAQIRFLSEKASLRDALIYDWADGSISGHTVSDDYSRFITSQLRLDADLVIQQTRRLTAVAAWRIRRGDRLADALGYAAHRFRVDEALLNNQPVEIAAVSRILAEDPTLPDDLRVAYARHVLAFSLALGDMQHAEPVAVMLRQHPDLERALQQQLSEAVAEGKARMVYDTLSRWLANPLGPVGTAWVEVTHRAAIARMDELVKARDVKAINEFLETLHHASPGVEISRAVPTLIEQALPLSVMDADLNLTLFLLAVNYLENNVLERLISAQKFTAQLPLSLSRLVPYITGADPGLCPSGLLMNTASAFGDRWRDLVLIRLAEIAVRSGRTDIVDTPALAGLVQLLPSAWGVQYSQTLRWIAKNLSTDEALMQLEAPGPTYLLQLMLATGGYPELGSEMLHQARLLYPGDKQSEYVAVVRRLFAETPMNTDEVPKALEGIGSGIKGLPLAMAYIGALEGHDWSSALDPVAEAATQMLYDNPSILEVIQPSAMIALLKFHVKRKDVPNTVRVGDLLVQVAARDGGRGVGLVGRMYKMMDWDSQVQVAGLELLRRYVRQASDEDARRGVTTFGREFGLNVQQALEATYALKRLMDDVDLLSYASYLHIAADFLYDTASAYCEPKRIPSLGSLMNDLDSMTGGLTDDDRRLIMRDLLGLGRALLVLGDFQIANRPRDFDKHIENLLAGKADPISALDVLYVMSGYFTKGKRYPLKLKPPASISPHTLGERSAPTLKEHVEIINGLLRSAIRAFPPDKRVTIRAAAIREELESLWGNIPLSKRRENVRDLAIDLQRVPELVVQIAAQGSAKALEDSGLARKLDENKQQPKNTIEFYRFIHGYFKARTRSR